MSRKGSTGSSLGICSCWSLSVVVASIASVNSGSLVIAMDVPFRLPINSHVCVLNRYQDLLSSAILDLWKIDMQHTVAKLSRNIADAESPTQRYKAAKLSETAFRTKIGNDSTPVLSSFLFTPDPELGVANTNLDLLGRYPRKFYANTDRFFRLTQSHRRRPRSGDQWIFRLGRFLQCRIETPDAITQSLHLKPF